MLQGKKIVLGITGSIAAYKAILLVRLFIKKGAEVKVIVTPAAKDFVSTLTLATLSKNKVLGALADEDTWANHVMLGRWADVMLIAPLSCNTLAKMANGLCDNLLLAVYLSATCPVLVAPAMDEDMWKHASTHRNIELIKSFGNTIIPVSTGELASGLFGEGRMEEPEEIVTYLEETIFRSTILKGKTALVTAGPTYEAIDPVRFIGNRSSGKMGFAIAEKLFERGANVTIVSGPANIRTKYKGIIIKRITSAEEMFAESSLLFDTADIIVMAAAVADYKLTNVFSEKIKKGDGELTLSLTKTKDILKTFGQNKKPGQLLIGFALETNNEKENAISKLKSKNADLIVLNSLKDEQAGFDKDTNKVTILDTLGNEFVYEAKSKQLVAEDIVDVIISKII